MSKAAVSALVWGVYLALLGAWLLFFPVSFCSLFGFAVPTDFWIRLFGGLLAIIGYLYLRAVQDNVRPFFRWSAEVRPVVLVVTMAFVLLGFSPPILVLFGAIDTLGAVWMWWSLRSEE